MKKKQIAITLGIMCLMLTCGIVIQLNTAKNASSTVGQSLKENSLRDEVLKWKEKYDKTYNDLDNANKELEKERKVSISDDDGSVEKQQELKNINTYLGLTDISGEGIIITVKDNTSSKIGTSSDLVHDSDLRAIVNELKNNDVEAICINNERIVPSTAITCAGTVIQINNETVGSPFVIKAIGNQEKLWGSLTRSGGFLEILESYGIGVEIKKSDNIKIDKYNGVLTDKYIENIQ